MAKIKFAQLTLSENSLYKGREFNEIELEAESKAEKLPKGKFARIDPIPGNLGFMLRNIKGGNQTVIRAMEIYLSKRGKGKGIGKYVHDFVIIWRNFDKFSQKRVDVFDWLCKNAEIDPARLFGIVCEGLFDINQADLALELIDTKSEVLDNVRKFARRERNFKDRELAAKATRLIEEKGTEINVVDARVNNLTLENSRFNSAIRQNETLIKDELVEAKETKQLNPASTKFIDTAFLVREEKEKEYVDSINS